MRTIKFRAWDKDKGMSDGFFIYNIGDDNGRQYIDGYGRIYDSTELMQFTGLLDKNGKEIYEGDIVEWHPDYDTSLGGKTVIVWDKDSWVASAENTGATDYYSYDGRGFQWEELEIIGNIYENPKLLASPKQDE